VLDASGAAVPNAAVQLANNETGVKTSAKTDSDGAYRFGNVQVGRYTVTVSASGFTSASVKDVSVELNKTSTVNLKIQVGAVATAIDVVEASAVIDTTTAQVSNSYERLMAAELPMAANPVGGVLNLSLLGAGIASSGGAGVGIGPSVGGQRPRNNNFTIEGVDNNRKDVTGPSVTVPNDAVMELTVLQNQFSAEYGHSSGGQFNTVVRGGSNDLHGTIYEYLLNRNLNALDQTFKRINILDKQRYDQNRLGGALGGPIKKNKLFYYGLYEYNPLGQASTPASATFSPTAEGYAALGSMQGISSVNLGILKQYLAPAPIASKTTTVNGIAIPIGTLPIVAPNYSNAYSWLVSMDYNLSDRDQLRGRYIDNKTSAINTAANLPVFFFPRPTTSHLVSISEFHNFTPAVTNELRLAFNRFNDNIATPDFQYPGLDVFPNIQIQKDLNVQIGPNPNGPQATVQSTYQIVDNLSWIKGKHDFKFGFDGRDLIAASTFIQRVRGDYDYNFLERFLQDKVPDVLAQRNVGGKPYSGNQLALYGFVNDNWRATRHVTLNLGLRYEFTSVPRSMREFSLNSLADVPGVLTFFEPKPQKKNFVPRVGFAYSPGSSASTSIRGGFSLAYDQIFDNVGTNTRPPQVTSTVDQPILTSDPSGFLAGGGIKPTTLAAALTPDQARAATSAWLPDQQLGYSVNWNFGVQHVFAKDYTAEVRYVGTRGVHLLYQLQLNRPDVVTPTHFLPTYLSAPSQATLDSLTLTQAQLSNERLTPGIGNTFAPYGFTSNITAYVPRGNSEYHGLAAELTKRFSRGLLFKGAYTWSHLLDDSTAEVNSTALSPRRPQDFNNIRGEWASSLLDRRQRLTLSWVYETQWFQKDGNWFKKNLLGNYEIGGAYSVESPEYVTAQGGVDANQNGDAATDRAIINPAGVKGTGSDVTALKNSAGAVVAFVANNPNAQYILAQAGALPTAGRNTLASRGINNWDVTLSKSLTFHERKKLQFRADFFNMFNHPQYTPGRINNVNATGRATVTNFLTPGNALFGQFDQVWSSNPRNIQVGAKFTF
jgi:hypothetical protein